MILALCLLLLVALGSAERVAGRRARAAVAIRIHVNGTRGKSIVTRLVAGALREAGIATLAKVTGTAPRLILPDGSERPVVRHAPASIREQAWLMRRAAAAGVRAVVVECMAVRPELQWISEREMVHATIGVITNARLDHTDVMGRTRDEIAQSLGNGIPRSGVLVVGDERLAALVSERCAAAGTRLAVAEATGPTSDVRLARRSALHERATFERSDVWMHESIATALAVTRELGIEDDVAWRGMLKAAPDPGVVAAGTVTVVGRPVDWVDATAANDPDSLDLLITRPRPRSTSALTDPEPEPTSGSSERSCVTQISEVFEAPGFSAARRHVCVYNHRADRPLRLLTFAQSSEVFRGSAAIVLTGDRPSLTLVVRVRRLCPDAVVRFAARRHLPAAIEGALRESAKPHAATSGPTIVYCGNTRAWQRPAFARAPADSSRASAGQATNDQQPRPTTNDRD